MQALLSRTPVHLRTRKIDKARSHTMSRRVMTNFTADDMGAASSPAEAAVPETQTQKSAKQTEKAPATAPPASEDEVPEGSVDELTEWVGDDKDRAEKALEAENAKDNPRVTAVEAFEAVLTEPEADEK